MKRLPFVGGFLSPYFWVEIFKKKDFGVEFNLNIKKNVFHEGMGVG